METARGSADGQVHLIGFSFGAAAATVLAHRFETTSQPSPIKLVTLITSELDIDTALTNCLILAAEDFSKVSPPKERRLRALIAKGPKVFNPEMKEGLELALSDPSLLTHY